MASFSRFISGIILVSLIVSCGQTGGDAPLSGSSFDYSICDTIVTTDLDSSAFNTLLQSGTSTDYFTACIEDGVTITDTNVNISSDYVAIVGVSRTGSVIEKLSYGKSSANGGLAVSNLTMNGSGMSGCLSSTNSVSGTITVSISDVTCNFTGGSMGSAFAFTSSAGSNIVTTIEDSSIVSSGNGISYTISAGGNMTGTISSNTITVAGAGLSFTESAGSGMSFNLAANKLRYNGASAGPFGTSAVVATASANGGITLNNTSSGSNNFACKVSSSAGTFSGVYQSTSSAGASIGGTFSAAGTQNGGDTVGTCP